VIEKTMKSLAGVIDAKATFGSGTVTVTFDETRTTLGALQDAASACGFHCRGVALPSHLCSPEQAHGRRMLDRQRPRACPRA
jgi:Cu2+-exporting ATPase